jgi:hypothetical protein
VPRERRRRAPEANAARGEERTPQDRDEHEPRPRDERSHRATAEPTRDINTAMLGVDGARGRWIGDELVHAAEGNDRTAP